MYFFLRYIDYEDFRKAEDADCVSLKESSIHSNFSGENKELIVNPDCYIGIILDYIYREVGIPDEMRSSFDLSTHRGKTINIAAFEPFSSGLSIFIEKSMYYIVTRDCNDQLNPLLHRESQDYMEFFAYLKKGSSLTKKRSSFSKSSGSKGSPQIRSLASKSSKGSLHRVAR